MLLLQGLFLLWDHWVILCFVSIKIYWILKKKKKIFLGFSFRFCFIVMFEWILSLYYCLCYLLLSLWWLSFWCSQRKMRNEAEGRVFIYLFMFTCFSLVSSLVDDGEEQWSRRKRKRDSREALQRQSGFHNFMTRKISEIVFIIFLFLI